MRVDLLPPEKWEDLNGTIHQFLKLSETVSVRTYKGLAHAAYEIAISAAQFFSHKRSIGLVKGNSPAFGGVMPILYKEGYQVQLLKAQDISAPQIWVEALKKDTNFVLFASDHPVTGEISNWRELDRLVNEKKMQTIRVSHTDWLHDISSGAVASLEPAANSATILSVTPDLALAICGAKFRAPPLIAPNLYWEPAAVHKDLKAVIEQYQENKAAILAFEKDLPQNWQAFFQHESRLFDRAVIYNPTVNSEAIAHELSERLKLSLPAPGFSTPVEAGNLCRWGGVGLYDDWWESKPRADILRGLLLISCNQILAQKSLGKTIDQSSEAVRV